MVDERDLSQEKQWYNEQMVDRCVRALQKNNMSAVRARDRAEARSAVLGLIPEGATIGFGDSMTLLQAGITEEIEKRGGDRVFNPFRQLAGGGFAYSGRSLIDTMRRAGTADVFLTGANAVTEDGKVVSTDGVGNRVGPLVFGPKKVIVVCGVNKIVPDVAAGLQRIRKVAAPLNARRHYVKHGAEALPCVATGQCSDCRHPLRMCAFTVIVEFQRRSSAAREPRINVVLIMEELGL